MKASSYVENTGKENGNAILAEFNRDSKADYSATLK